MSFIKHSEYEGKILVKPNAWSNLKTHKGTLIIILAIILFIGGGVAFLYNTLGMSGSERIAIDAIKTLQDELPSSTQVFSYTAYVNLNYENGKAALIQYTAQDKNGDFIDDWVLISETKFQSNNDYKNAVDQDNSAAILANASVAFAKFDVSMGSDGWESINLNKWRNRIE